MDGRKRWFSRARGFSQRQLTGLEQSTDREEKPAIGTYIKLLPRDAN